MQPTSLEQGWKKSEASKQAPMVQNVRKSSGTALTVSASLNAVPWTLCLPHSRPRFSSGGTLA